MVPKEARDAATIPDPASVCGTQLIMRWIFSFLSFDSNSEERWWRQGAGCSRGLKLSRPNVTWWPPPHANEAQGPGCFLGWPVAVKKQNGQWGGAPCPDWPGPCHVINALFGAHRKLGGLTSQQNAGLQFSIYFHVIRLLSHLRVCVSVSVCSWGRGAGEGGKGGRTGQLPQR